jgi:hypothetical protein
MPRKTTPALAVLSIALLAPAAQAVPAAQASLPTAEVFAPGIISGPANEGSPSFSPDGQTLLFTRNATRWSIVLESHLARGQWSEPKVAPFSGQWSDSSPAFSPDGSFVVFVSVRPEAARPDSTKPAAGAAPSMVSHLWRVNRQVNGQGETWSEPAELPATVNAFPAIFRPSVAADGSIYFTAGQKGKNLSLFRAKFVSGAYLPAEPLAFSDGSVKDVDPEIAPDQSFLVFTSIGRRPDEPVHDHLFLVRSVAGTWGAIVPIRYAEDDAKGGSEDSDPRLSPDRRTLYFSSDRAFPVQLPRSHEQAVRDYERLRLWDNSNTNIWSIPLATDLD